MTYYINEVAHDHMWTVPVLSADKLTLAGYACPCGETTHKHDWDIIHRVEGGFSDGAVKSWECSQYGEKVICVPFFSERRCLL